MSFQIRKRHAASGSMSFWASAAAFALVIAWSPLQPGLPREADPCTARKNWTEAYKNPPAQPRPSGTRQAEEIQLEIFQEAVADTTLPPARRKKMGEYLELTKQAIALHDQWDAYEAKRTAYEQAKKAADDELANAMGVFNTEAQRVQQKKDALAGKPRDESYYLTVREVKADALSVFQNLRKRLLPYECFRDVATFIKDKLDRNIQRFQPQTTALADADLDEELFDMLELPTAEEMRGPDTPRSEEADGLGEDLAGADEDEGFDEGEETDEGEWIDEEEAGGGLVGADEDEAGKGAGGGPCAGWTGQWDTSYGKMSLGGGSGSYDYHGNAEHAGTVTAKKVEGNVLQGDWKQADGKHGTFRFEMDLGTGNFSGWWSYHNNFDGGGWSGKCLSGS